MPSRLFFVLLVSAPIGAAVARDATAILATGHPFALPGGQSLELIEVADSRCAPSARCTSAGYVRLLLHWRSSPAAEPMRLTLATTSADGQTRQACLNGTLVRIRSITPLPKAGVSISMDDYRITVAIGTCPNEGATS